MRSLVALLLAGCVEHYVVRAELLEQAEAIENKEQQSTAILGQRSDGNKVYVLTEALERDGSPVGGRQRVRAINHRLGAGIAMLVAGLGVALGAIVVSQQPLPPAEPCAIAVPCFSGVGEAIDRAIKVIALGVTAGVLGIVGVPLVATSTDRHRFEIPRNRKRITYFGDPAASGF